MQKIVEALKKNNINVITAENSAEVVSTVKDMLFDGCTITCGGSVSVQESGVWELINDSRYNFLDRNRDGITDDERTAVYKATVGSDFYFCSANAITKKGEILNVDGNSNRISAIAFGPKRVIMIVGKNKLVDNLNDAFLRVKRIAAPKNCVRLGINNPCAKLGHCIALENSDNPDFTDGCATERRICRNYLISTIQQHKDRITVILVDKNLGY